MKTRYKGMSLLITVLVMATSCKKFDEINTNPLAASADQVQAARATSLLDELQAGAQGSRPSDVNGVDELG